jgi:L-threonylcarbamoyladenylate synthase
MQTTILSTSEPDAIARTAAAARAGGLVVIPTDTVYGVGCTVWEESVIRRLYAAKLRPLHKAIPVLLADETDLEKIVAAVPPMAQKLITRFWPGPLTIVLPKRSHLPPALSPSATVAVRMPDHDAARAVIRAAGGVMAVTSANASGSPPALNAAAAYNALAGRVKIILDDGRAPVGEPSTVLDLSGNEPRILRPGPLTLADLVVHQ